MSADTGNTGRAGPRPRGRRRTDLALAIGVFAALIAAILPLLRVIEAGSWLPAALAVAAAVLAAGFVARWSRLPGVAVALIEAAVWMLALTALFGRSSALLWIIPLPDTFQLVPVLVSAGVEEIMLGAAPLEAGTPLSFVLVGAVGLVALAIDHVVLTARMPLLAAIGLIAVSLIPAIAVPGDVDVLAFVLLATAVLFLLRVDTRARQRGAATASPGDPPSRVSGATATAVGIGAVAVIVAVVAAPLLPAPVARAGSAGFGAGTTIDPTLELGDDLRQPREVEVLSVRSTAPNPPYLRAVTLSRFDGAVWEPDDGRTLPLSETGELPELEVDPDIAMSEYRTTVEISDLNSPWLPVPYPARSIDGLDGAWGALAQNRTVVTRTGSTQGQVYEVVTTVPRPTLEQIRAREAAPEGVREETLALPAGMPPVIAQRAQEITATAANDYDALQALQGWFRSTAFRYSLDAPVDDGFDGSGADAVARFLDQREGYCVHFASAFALMARTLGMPSRIVVGYLPGVNTSAAAQGQTIYAVSSSQLHAWPEVHFAGVGWVAFEPTNSLGVPTSFASALTPGTGSPADRGPQDAAEATAAPTATPTAGSRPQDDLAAGGGPGAGTTRNPWPGVTVGAAVLLLLCAPALVRAMRGGRRAAAARAGDAAAAWRSVQEAAIDLGIPVPASESPRAFGARLSAAGAPAPAVTVLVAAIEQVSYGPGPSRGAGDGLASALAEVRAGLAHGVPRWRRLLAATVPRSLVVRPGSAYAHPPAPATAR